MALNDAQIAQTAEPMVKKIPVLGQVYAAAEAVGSILHKAFPEVFATFGSLRAETIAKFNQQVYNGYKDQKYFAILFDDPDFTIQTSVLGGINPMIVMSQSEYDRLSGIGIIVNGQSIQPIEGKYLLFPNIVKEYVTKEVSRIFEEQQIQTQKDTYGPFYPIVNWFKTNITQSNIQNTVSTATADLKNTFSNTNTTWQPYAIAGLAVVGVLGITYLILED